MKSFIKHLFFSFVTSVCLIAQLNFAFAQSAGLLPNALQQYFDNNGNPLSLGTVGFYIPNTTSLKTVWQDTAETTPWANPITLDVGGKPPGSAAGIYGQGTYRQIVKDRNGNTIWDAVTAAQGAGSGTLIGDGQPVGTIKPWAGIAAPNQYAFAYGQTLLRTTYPDLLIAITITESATCTNTSNIITALSDTSQIPIGSPVELACVAPGTTVTAKTTTTATLSNSATVTENSTAVFFPWGNGDGSTTFTIPDLRGVVLAGRTNMGGTAKTNLTSTYYSGVNPSAQGAYGGSQSYSFLQANLPNVNFTNSGISVANNGNTGITVFNAGNTGISITGGTLIGSVQTYNAFNGGNGFTSLVSTAASPNGAVANVAVGSINISIGNQGNSQVSVSSQGNSQVTIASQGSATSGGSGTPMSLVQPTVTINYIIKITPDINQSTTNGVASIGGMTGVIACGPGIVCTGNVISGANASAAGIDTEVQYNDLGVLGASPNFTFNYSTFNLTLGASGTLGSLTFGNATSGLLTIEPVTGILGTSTVFVPSINNDTILTKTSLATVTNKTFDTAGTGNFFSVNGTGLTGVTGSGNTVVLANTPTLITPVIGAATGTSLNLSGTLAFGILSPTSLGASPTTITGLALNNSPIPGSDYLAYYSSANGAINKATISSIVSSSVAGVGSVNSLTGNLSLAEASNSGFHFTNSGTSITLYNDGGFGGFVNRLRNGTFDIWQRGTTALIPLTTSPGTYTADGWQVQQAGVVGSCAQDTGNNGALFSLKCVGAVSNTDTVVRQPIESADANILAGNTVTVQFQYKQDTGGSITPKLSTCYASATDNFATCTGDLSSTSLTSCATATWCTESYTISSVSANASNGYRVEFDCNTALTASQHCWITAADTRVTPGVSTGVNTAPPAPELRSIESELAQCHRYYTTTYGNGIAPGTATTNGMVAVDFLYQSVFAWQPSISFPVSMRAIPGTISFWDGAGTSSKLSWLGSAGTSFTNGVTNSGTGAFAISKTGFLFQGFNAAQSATYYIHYTATAEL